MTGARRMSPADRARQIELAKIHMAASSVGLIQKDDDSGYRQMLREVAEVDSAKDLDQAGRAKVLAFLVSRGWVDRSAPRGKPGASPSRYVRGTKPALIRWLWSQLHRAGLVEHNTEHALRRYIAQHAGLATPKETITERDARHLSDSEANHVIEQLKRWLARAEDKIHG